MTCRPRTSRPRRRTAGFPAGGLCCALLGLTLTGGGCSALNGLYFGLEEDVDALAAGLDSAGDRFLPHGPRPPLEARRAHRDHVRFRDDPLAGADRRARTRPAGHRFRGLGPREPGPAPDPAGAPAAPAPPAPDAAPAAPAPASPQPPAGWRVGPPRHHELTAPAPAAPPLEPVARRRAG